jgi:hypothetical protein
VGAVKRPGGEVKGGGSIGVSLRYALRLDAAAPNPLYTVLWIRRWDIADMARLLENADSVCIAIYSAYGLFE